jgi:hypothetical protein
MARVGRLAGAILAESRGQYCLVGNTKRPCDWDAAGFEPPAPLEPAREPFVWLTSRGVVDLGSPVLTLPLEGEALALALSQRFVIERNGSVSERLWRLVVDGGHPEPGEEAQGEVDARWLAEIPAPLWQIVRDAVLRCL